VRILKPDFGPAETPARIFEPDKKGCRGGLGEIAENLIEAQIFEPGGNG
jgi:hypothetical protein